MKNILVLGGGRVGSAIAWDLSKNNSISVADINQKNLEKIRKKNPKINLIKEDLSNKKKLQNLIFNFDLIISAVPGFMGYKTLKTIIENKKNVIDISFFPENGLDLNKLAKSNKVTALIDFGVAPGLSNIIFGYYDSIFKIDSYECYVGGLPIKKVLPFEYKAPFSPIDVIEEYIRPARLFENGQIIIKAPLSEREIINFDTNEDLEAFNTDGLRSLLFTMSHVADMKEKTLRYPGHAEKIQLLKDIGLFSQEKKCINGTIIKPIELTAQLLEKEWQLGDGEREFTTMRIVLKNKKKSYEINLYDEYDHETNITSMARTTGYTCTAGAALLINNIFKKKGIYTPELIGKEKKCYDFILDYLKERNINLKTKITNSL
ncbi:MAG: saccharopine dehydrogenase [Flavobacteriales bacterium]|nr:saccharopine dehydrogenase [Flavobacteriales bacterium]|tara:strand:+ start:15976 stop:17103 length:1128 start_codon:yes stop_codon:yes gene_type:complete